MSSGTPDAGAVDSHSHLIPERLLARIRAGQGPSGVRAERRDGGEWIVHPGGFAYPLDPVFHSMEARLAAMVDAGIAARVISVTPDLFGYALGADEGAEHCALINDAVAETVAEEPEKLVGLATLPMQDPGTAATELVRAVRELGLRGAQIGPVIGDHWLDDRRFLPVLEAASDLQVPLLLHPYYHGPRADLADYYLVNLVGNPLQTTTAAVRLILGGVLDALPALRIVLVHAGGFLPYQIGRVDHGWEVRPEAKGCAAAPSSYLRRFSYDTVTHAPASLRFLVDLVGADAVLYGTDAPFDMGDGTVDDQLGAAASDPALRAAVAGDNARRLFKF